MISAPTASAPYFYRRGAGPLVVSIPHAGTWIPPDIARSMTDAAAGRPCTDWHLPRLYDFAAELDATIIAARYSRYVVDLNRPPDDENLYPGQDTTGLCPVDTFDHAPLYRDAKPDAKEAKRRVARYWQPYHGRIATELARVKAANGVAMLWDAHSIAAVVPRFFEGRLADLNLGTANGASCDPRLSARLAERAAAATGFTAVVNGRFKGGYITRRYGRPAENVHAVQLELSEATYMQESAPFAYDPQVATQVKPVLRDFLQIMIDFAAESR